VMDERLEAMKRIWADERAEYHGRHVDFAPIYAWPKPAQKPHPPIHVAANAPKGLSRVVRQGDGWFPLMQEGNPGSITDHLPALRERVAADGRNPDAFEVSVYLCPPEKDLLRTFRDAGVHRIVFLLDPLARDAALRQLDERTELMASCA